MLGSVSNVPNTEGWRNLQAAVSRSCVAVVVSPVIETHKTISWRNERKWAHRKMHQRNRVHRIVSTRVPSYDFVYSNYTVYVNQATYDLLKTLPSK